MTKYTLPLGIDLHVHYRTPGHPNKETIATGYKASLAGGTGTVIDMPNTQPPIDTIENYKAKLDLLGDKKKYIHQAVAITNDNVISGHIKQLAPEVKIYKVFMANSTGDLGISIKNLREAFSILDDFKPLVMVHAEDPNLIKKRDLQTAENDVRPVQAEINAIEDVLTLADDFGNIRFHATHVSSFSAADLLNTQSTVSWDVLPKHLQFNTGLVQHLGNYAKMNPPLRIEEERRKLFQLFTEGKIPIITSDHAPHTKEDKQLPVAGAPGAQEIYYFLIDNWLRGNISKDNMLDMIYNNPKSLLEEQNLMIREGNIILESEDQFLINHNIVSKCGWSLWEDYEFQGKIYQVN